MVDNAPAATTEKPADGAAAAPAAETILDAAKPAPDNSDGKPKSAAEPAKPAVDATGKPTTEPAKPADGKPAVEKPAAETKPTGAPEKYEPFKTPEGVKFEPANQEKFSVVAKELGLTQEAAQKLVDYQANVIKENIDDQKKTFDAMQKEWADQTKKDLGADAEKQLAFAAAARDRFATPELRELFKDSGLGNHPAVVKHFIALGKAISEDSFVDGKPGTDGNAGKSAAEIIYPNQGKEKK